MNILNFKEEVKNALDAMIELKEQLERELKLLPKGSLAIKTVNNHEYFYHVFYEVEKGEKLRKQVIIRGDEEELKLKLKRRKYISVQLDNIKHNIKVAEKTLCCIRESDLQTVVGNLSKVYKNIPDHCFLELVGEPPERFGRINVNKNPKYPEGLVHSTARGDKVRSKSEVIIADQLYSLGIPYNYEPEIELEGKKFNPDFEVWSYKFNRVIYWEHFGLINKASYVSCMVRKKSIYMRNGIVPWNNLIETFDDEEGVIDGAIIRNIAKIFLV